MSQSAPSFISQPSDEQETESPGVSVVTFGCRLNTYESEVMKREANVAGLGELPGGALVFNTCAVTAEATRQARQAIRKARRENPDARIIVTGCAAQTDPDSFGGMDEVDLVIGNGDKLKAQSYRALPDFGVNSTEKVRVNDIFELTETAAHMVDAIEGRARAFLQVQNGCDHRCTFCIIPYGRGNSRSVPAGGVVGEARRLVGNGYSEIVLTGVDMTSWGNDLPGQPKLGRLVRAILKGVPDLKRLRLSSIDSIEADDDLLAALAEDERLMPHLHLSLQHGDDLILKRMKRRHLRDDAIAFCRKARQLRPDVALGADLIAGFPTESEEAFDNTLSLIEECELSFLHVFPFSPRDGTPAARMPQLPRPIVKDRAARMRRVADSALTRHLRDRVGTSQPILIEKPGFGRAPDYTPVRLASGGEIEPGTIVAATITDHDGSSLLGRLTVQEPREMIIS
ncbi:tRNA (N(6)-L-threonylcarbamoyladenosine(37)-C(2))-methylthiotransferase MtaB [Notoacmeibacter ruber]|uniref:tRNA (N(6)-L-threonylcarbamoyladenosine(37)-C(2))-methylthiotransferase MtaB n=1 Tax=Notoacmeibacter ruber TaxID=2670375 RepID=A0A3L7JEI9_9HYPH|nr:tRNA (N(6)-L-threonylcarbamoyladenosine(37)-C(2))-methylthiotransferase MtaB [Notoacmeibacter ruber]RLQ89096.1 tRNA (N(6)-L-threonylcarbamoyladenosine(37)-C(2))-methylthiotransferase MtaB [Notoacmeibacter ruber]